MREQITFTHREPKTLPTGQRILGGCSGILGNATRYGATEADVLASFSGSIGQSMHDMAAAIGHTFRYQARVAALRDAIAAGQISHSRASRFGIGSVDVYRHESSSPTGVMHFDSFLESDTVVMTLLRGGLSPLSPTENR